MKGLKYTKNGLSQLSKKKKAKKKLFFRTFFSSTGTVVRTYIAGIEYFTKSHDLCAVETSKHGTHKTHQHNTFP